MPDRDEIDHWCERGILGLVLAILVFGPLGFGAVDQPQVLIIQGLTCGVLALWVARAWLSKSYRILWPPVCWAVLLFLGYAAARYKMLLDGSGVEYLARQEVLLILTYGALFFAILNNLSRGESTQIIAMVLICVGTLISLYALYQFLTKSRAVLWTTQLAGYKGRGSGTYICPNHLAGFLEMILPLALAYTLTGRFKPISKVFLGYATFALFTGIGVSVSRGAWISTGLAFLLFFGLLMRQRGQRLAGVIFFVLLLGAFVFFVKNLAVLQHRVGISSTEARIDSVRLGLWQPAIQMWKDHFWWGAGPNQFDLRFRKYRPDDIQMRPLYAHNDYLNTLADYGLTGIILVGGVVVLLGLGVFQSWKYVQRSNDIAAKKSNRAAFVLGGAAGLVAILAHSLMDFNMHIPANAIVAVTLMALLSGHMRFSTERYWRKLQWAGKPLLSLVLLGVCGFLATQVGHGAQEQRFLRKAARAKEFDNRVSELKAAYSVESQNSETTYQLGELYRLASWESATEYRQLATQAMEWFGRAVKVNPFDPYIYVGLGMCLHWLDRSGEAEPYFIKALELDPKNYIIQGNAGWHYFQLGAWDQSEHWYTQAVFYAHWHPDVRFKSYEEGRMYLRLIQERRAEKPALPDAGSGGAPSAK